VGDRRRFRPCGCGCDRLRARQRHGYPVLPPASHRFPRWEPTVPQNRLGSPAPRSPPASTCAGYCFGWLGASGVHTRSDTSCGGRTTGLRAKQLPGVGCRLPLVLVLPEPTVFSFQFLLRTRLQKRPHCWMDLILWLTGWVVVAIFHAVVNLQVTVTLNLSTVCSKVLLRLLHMLYSPFAITSVSTSFGTMMKYEIFPPDSYIWDDQKTQCIIFDFCQIFVGCGSELIVVVPR
jgi:hypothetical protein